MGNIMTIKHGNGVPKGKLKHYEFGYSDDKKNLYLNTPAALVALNLGKFDINDCEEIATDEDLNNCIDVGTYICKDIGSLINKPDTTATEAKLFVIKIANNEEIFQILIDNDNCIWIRTYVEEWKEWINCAEKTIIDSELSLTSINPVQNKIITAALNNKLSLDGGEIKGSLIIDKNLELKDKIIFPQNDYSGGDSYNTFINEGFFINNMIPDELENQPTNYGILVNFSNENSDGHLLWMEQKDGAIYHKGYNPFYIGGKWKKLIDNSMVNQLIWSGTASEEDVITIPDLSKYSVLRIAYVGAATLMLATKSGSYLRGCGGFTSDAGNIYYYTFAAKISGNDLTLHKMNNIKVYPQLGSYTTMQLEFVYGLI